MHQCECEESDHTINEQIINLKPIKWLPKTKAFPNSNATTQKMNFSLSYADELREKKECNFWSFYYKVSRASKLNRACRGRFASFKEMSSKKFD